MASRTESSILPSWPVATIMALLLGNLYMARMPLRSSRPELPPITHQAEDHRIDARLWQDPFAVVAQHAAQDAAAEAKAAEGKSAAASATKAAAAAEAHADEKEHAATSAAAAAKNDVAFAKTRDDTYPHFMPLLTADLRRRAELHKQPGAPAIRVMLVLLRDATLFEDREWRIRTRMTVGTALRAQGYRAEDSEHISYCRVPWSSRDDLAQCLEGFSSNESAAPSARKKLEDSAGKSPPTPHWLQVPYEWYGKDPLANRPEAKAPQVLVCWLPSSEFADHTLGRLAVFAEDLETGIGSQLEPRIWSGSARKTAGEANQANVVLDVIGPTDSTMLRSMYDDAHNKTKLHAICEHCCKIADSEQQCDYLNFYSPWTTAEPFLLAEGVTGTTECCASNGKLSPSDSVAKDSLNVAANKFYGALGVKTYIPTIVSDDRLAEALIEELSLRSASVRPPAPDPAAARAQYEKSPGSDVALVCEDDSFYGRAFVDSFAAAMWNSAEERAAGDSSKLMGERTVGWRRSVRNGEDNRPPNLHVYAYVRGVDGKAFASDGIAENPRTNEKSSQLALTEPPVGQGQLDYVQRLARKLADDAQRGERQFRAIGVIGTDVYDKLLLFQALRAEFPNAVYFTSDLDARLIHRQHFQWTRNVVVASGYGLALADEFQLSAGVATFRDSYQTSTYVATSHALMNTPRLKWGFGTDDESKSPIAVLPPPRVFEIGRGTVVDLSDQPSRLESKIHPPPRDWPRTGYFVAAALAAVSGLALLVFVLPPFRRFIVESLSPSVRSRWQLHEQGLAPWLKDLKAQRWWAGLFILLAAVLFAAVVIVSIVIDHGRSGGEPFSLFSGTCSWPAIILRGLAAIVSLYFFLSAWFSLRSDERQIRLVYGLASAESEPEQRRWYPTTMWHPARSAPPPAAEAEPPASAAEPPVSGAQISVDTLWNQYCARGTWFNRLIRTLFMVVLYVVLALSLRSLFGYPLDPYRGLWNNWLGIGVTFVSAVLLLALTCLVVDATNLSLHLVQNLASEPSKYSPETLELFADERGMSEDVLIEWLDIQFIADHTESIYKMIYYPFILFLIMIFARLDWFDNFRWTMPIIVLYAMLFSYAAWCAFSLSQAAESARLRSLSRLQQLLVYEMGQQSNRVAQIKQVMEEIEGLRRGAFCPLPENPVVRAILIPASGATFIQLAEYLSRS